MRRLQIDSTACILWALSVLIVPFRWLISALTAAVIHELCHILAIRLAGSTVRAVRIGFFGTVISTGPLTDLQEGFCALAGPVGSLLLAFLARRFPVLAFCALVQGVFNLLPVYPMDGGRAVLALLKRWLPESKKTDAVVWAERISVTLMGVLCVLCAVVTDLVILPLLAMISAAYRLMAGKKPCKRTRQALQ